MTWVNGFSALHAYLAIIFVLSINFKFPDYFWRIADGPVSRSGSQHGSRDNSAAEISQADVELEKSEERKMQQHPISESFNTEQ